MIAGWPRGWWSGQFDSAKAAWPDRLVPAGPRVSRLLLQNWTATSPIRPAVPGRLLEHAARKDASGARHFMPGQAADFPGKLLNLRPRPCGTVKAAGGLRPPQQMSGFCAPDSSSETFNFKIVSEVLVSGIRPDDP